MRLRPPASSDRRYLTLIIIIGFLSLSAGHLFTEGRSTADITPVRIDGAPSGIVFIADPHLRQSTINQTKEIIRQINDLHPSVVLIGGDFTYGKGEDEKELALQEIWSEIDAPVYAVLGNHDYQSGTDASGWLQKTFQQRKMSLECGNYDVSCLRDDASDTEYANTISGVLEKNGVKVLRNEYKEILIDNRSVVIAGVDDCWAGMANPPSVPNNGSYIIYMIHEPECRADWDADLILAGHTHGGQYIPPGFERIISGGHVVLSGRVDKGRTTTYITRGIGTSNLNTPIRFAPPEIVIINPQSDNRCGTVTPDIL
jgi:predicted MPP superfamily phosphohydrolase